jgi:hypothetical protein
MNFLPAASRAANGAVGGQDHPLALPGTCVLPKGRIKLGIRPEYLSISAGRRARHCCPRP